MKAHPLNLLAAAITTYTNDVYQQDGCNTAEHHEEVLALRALELIPPDLLRLNNWREPVRERELGRLVFVGVRDNHYAFIDVNTVLLVDFDLGIVLNEGTQRILSFARIAFVDEDIHLLLLCKFNVQIDLALVSFLLHFVNDLLHLGVRVLRQLVVAEIVLAHLHSSQPVPHLLGVHHLLYVLDF